MIRLKHLQEYAELLVDNVPGLNHYLVVKEESHLAKQVSDLTQQHYPLLAVTYPAAQSTGNNADNLSFNNAVLFFVLFKDPQDARSFQQEIDQYDAAQTIALNIVWQMLQDVANPELACSFIKKLDASSISLEPENLIAGCEGWSLSVSFSKTNLPTNFEELAALYPATFEWLKEGW